MARTLSNRAADAGGPDTRSRHRQKSVARRQIEPGSRGDHRPRRHWRRFAPLVPSSQSSRASPSSIAPPLSWSRRWLRALDIRRCCVERSDGHMAARPPGSVPAALRTRGEIRRALEAGAGGRRSLSVASARGSRAQRGIASRLLTNVGPSRARRFGTRPDDSEGFAARRGIAAVTELRRDFATKSSSRRSA